MGYVYLLTDGEHYKIGVTRGSIQSRIKKLQTGNPYDIAIIDYHKSKHPFHVEKMLHRLHARKRFNNEWFELTQADVSKFQAECDRFDSIIDSLEDNPFFH